MNLIPNENLTLTNAREPRNDEHSQGAEGVLEFQCQETGARLKVLMKGRHTKNPFAWVPVEQKFIPERGTDLLLEISQTVKDWAEHGCKYVKRYSETVKI